MRGFVTFCCTLGALVTSAAAAAAQGNRPPDRWDREVADQLRRAGQALQEQGYRARPEPLAGALNQGETEQLWIGLRQGGEYALVAVCDSACGDLDLRLLDEGSHEVAVAIDPGPPVLRISPSRNGKYRLRVVMVACGHSPCRYGVGVFEK